MPNMGIKRDGQTKITIRQTNKDVKIDSSAI